MTLEERAQKLEFVVNWPRLKEKITQAITEAVAEERAKWECDGMATHEATEEVDIDFAIATAERLGRREEREACAHRVISFCKEDEAYTPKKIAAAIRAREEAL